MANNIDIISTRFFDQRIKVPKVICTEQVQEVGQVTIPAPAGLTLDVLTGLLNATVSLQLAGTPQIRSITVLPNKIVNMGVVPVSLSVNNVVAIQLLEIPFQAEVECPGAAPGEDIVQKHDVEVEGFAISPVQILAGTPAVLTLSLILKTVVNVCVVVSKETILKINAAEPFCK